MGLFYNYSKPGPGVSKNEKKKKGVALYFQLFFRHFSDFIKENFLYIIASLPMFLILYFCFLTMDTFGIMNILIDQSVDNLYDFLNFISILTTILFVILCGSGPASAGMAYMMRCITREEHCFLWSDFWGKFKENFKNSILLTIIDIVFLVFVAPVAIKFYYSQYIATSNILWFAIMAILFMLLLTYILMHIYFYQLIITFELKFKDAFKNSLMMAIAYLPFNLLIISIPVILTSLLMLYFISALGIILTIICWISFMRYPIEFFAARLIQKKFIEEQK